MLNADCVQEFRGKRMTTCAYRVRAWRIERGEGLGGLESAAGAQDQGIGADGSDDLQADRQARFGEAAGNGGGRLLVRLKG